MFRYLSVSVCIVLILPEIHLFIFGISVRYSERENPSASRQEEYLFAREHTILQSANLMLGHSLPLNEKERLVNEVLMRFKHQEFKEGLESHGKHFLAATHFFHAKPKIEKSHVFHLIKMIPKGAALHLHLEMAVSIDFLVNNLTKQNNFYYGVGPRNNLMFRFSDKYPEISQCNNWKYIQRNASLNNETLNEWFYKSMSLFSSQPEIDYPTAEKAWIEFEDRVDANVGLTYYEQAARETLSQILKEFYEDNIFYIEPRVTLEGHYYLNQSKMSPTDILKLSVETLEKFQKDYPDFWGAKFIYAPQRTNKPEVVKRYLNEALTLQKKFPEHFAGFDLVGEEDLGLPLKDFLPELLKAGDKGLRYFFHAGETLWQGTEVDENLIDAVLLNTSRLSHAYALRYYPGLIERVKQNGIAIEVCPVSSQVLGYVNDLRTHPMAQYFKDGFPIVIGGDDNGVWEALPLSHDWYYAFMALGGRRADLRFLKQLAINSIKYSAASSREKESWLRKWIQKWHQFLDKVIAEFKIAS